MQATTTGRATVTALPCRPKSVVAGSLASMQPRPPTSSISNWLLAGSRERLDLALSHHAFRHGAFRRRIHANARNAAVTNLLERLDDAFAHQRQDGNRCEHARGDERERAAALREDPHDAQRQEPRQNADRQEKPTHDISPQLSVGEMVER